MSSKKNKKLQAEENQGDRMVNQSSKISHVLGGDYNITIGGDVTGYNLVSNNQSDILRDEFLDATIIDAKKIFRDKNKVIEKLNLRLSIYEVTRMSFELGIDYDNLKGETKIQKISSLIESLETTSDLPKLLAFLQKTHPDVFDTLSDIV